MPQLSDEQVDIIEQRINQDGVTTTTLQSGLLDHYCCFIEEAMERDNIDFDTAYGLAFKAITPNGMHEIQEELFFLLTFKKQTNMKKIIYGAGFLAAFCISMGLLFKILHWPGANVMLLSGFGALIVTLTTLLTHSLRYMKNYPTSYNVRVLAGFAGGVLVASGSMFKILYYPGANIQTVLGMFILNFIFLPLFFLQLYKQSIAKMN